MQSIVITTPPTWEPVSLAEARLHCRVDLHDEDTLIAGWIRAARRHCEDISWRVFATQTIDLWLEGWPANERIKLPYPPLQSVTHIKYYDTADVEYTLATTVYYANTIATPGEIRLKHDQSYPGTTLREYNAVNVRYVAGYATPELVPDEYKQAIYLLVSHWNENRESAISGTISREIDFGVRSLLRIDRAFEF